MTITNRLSRLIALAVCAQVFAAGFAHAGNETSAATNSLAHESATQRDARMKWWRDARFGMCRPDLTFGSPAPPPFQRPPLPERASACKPEAIPLSFYHSIMDWHPPDGGIRRAWNDVAAQAGAPNMDNSKSNRPNSSH